MPHRRLSEVQRVAKPHYGNRHHNLLPISFSSISSLSSRLGRRTSSSKTTEGQNSAIFPVSHVARDNRVTASESRNATCTRRGHVMRLCERTIPLQNDRRSKLCDLCAFASFRVRPRCRDNSAHVVRFKSLFSGFAPAYRLDW